MYYYSLQTVPVTETDKPTDLPLPSGLGPIEKVEVEFRVTNPAGEEEPKPSSAELLIKGCLHGMYRLSRYFAYNTKYFLYVSILCKV